MYSVLKEISSINGPTSFEAYRTENLDKTKEWINRALISRLTGLTFLQFLNSTPEEIEKIMNEKNSK
jgi:hypothetical protein